MRKKFILITNIKLILVVIAISLFFILADGSIELKAEEGVTGEIIRTVIDIDTAWTRSQSPYIFDCEANRICNLEIMAGVTLTVEPGVVIKSNRNAIFSVYGRLIASGTLADPIIFTSVYDNEYGGDTSPTPREPQAGDWAAIGIVGINAEAIFSNTIIQYGGRFKIDDGSENENTQDVGTIFSMLGRTIISNSRLVNNMIGIEYMASIYEGEIAVTIRDSIIAGNKIAAIRVDGESAIEAVNNWWGHGSGPFHATLNPNGQKLIDRWEVLGNNFYTL